MAEGQSNDDVSCATGTPGLPLGQAGARTTRGLARNDARKALPTAFSLHPDYTVGSGIAPDLLTLSTRKALAGSAKAITAGGDFHPALRTCLIFSDGQLRYKPAGRITRRALSGAQTAGVARSPHNVREVGAVPAAQHPLLRPAGPVRP